MIQKSLLVVCVLCVGAVSAKGGNYQNIKVGNTNCFVDGINEDVKRTKVEKDIEVVASFFNKCKSLKYRQVKLQVDKMAAGADTVRVERKKDGIHRILFEGGRKKGVSVAIDSLHVIRKLYLGGGGRALTEAEEKECAMGDRIPESYKKVSKEDALQMAYAVNTFVYGEEEADKFDSVTVDEARKAYSVRFMVKPRNDIFDMREVTVTIDANNGQIRSVYTNGARNLDYSYVPKIKKEQVLEMYRHIVDSLHATVNIRKVGLTMYSYGDVGPERWTWQVFGDRKDKMISMAAMLFVDSETGEIIYVNME